MSQNEIEKLRAAHNLTLIPSEREGVSWHKISGGVYGFTYTPAASDGGIFIRQSHLSFEFHKLADGTLQFLGFTTPASAEALASAGAPEIEIYPIPKHEHTVLVAVPHARIASSKPLDKEDANRLKLSLRPA